METLKTEEEIKALNLLEKSRVNMAIKFKYSGPHFLDDTENRDVYDVTLEKGNKKESFSFGQSLCHSKDFVMKEWYSVRDNRDYTLKERLKAIKEIKEPSVYDILSVIQKYDVGTFEDFRSEFGYPYDSKKAESVYFAVQKEYQMIKTFFQGHMEELMEIQ